MHTSPSSKRVPYPVRGLIQNPVLHLLDLQMRSLSRTGIDTYNPAHRSPPWRFLIPYGDWFIIIISSAFVYAFLIPYGDWYSLCRKHLPCRFCSLSRTGIDTVCHRAVHRAVHRFLIPSRTGIDTITIFRKQILRHVPYPVRGLIPAASHTVHLPFACSLSHFRLRMCNCQRELAVRSGIDTFQWCSHTLR